jgi:hypothetical protein
MMMIDQILRLPDDLIHYIRDYLPLRTQIMVNKKLYIQNHKHIRSWIPKNQYENYVRTMVRHDNDFVFKHILQENFYKWLYFKKYLYTDIEYIHYLYFLLDYCQEHESTQCYHLLKKTLEYHGLHQNQHKKNLRHSIWLI